MARALTVAQGFGWRGVRRRPRGWENSFERSRPAAALDVALLVRTPLERLLLGDDDGAAIPPREDERRRASKSARR